MTTTSKRLDEFVALRPRDFSVVKMIAISQGDNPRGEHEQRLSLVLIKEVDNDRDSLALEFYGVRHLELAQPDYSVMNIHIEILEGSAIPGKEGVYFVRDSEQDRVICFECRDFEAYRT